uniref:ribonuclease T2-like isoform X2 n=1 Tax=Pristiophorus japonicus TaxID=55135 RepID=UPI00398EB411
MALYAAICLTVLYGLTAATQVDMNDSCRWKCLTFAQLWPGSFCVTFSSKQCRIPKYVTGWTIHGLWPDGKKYCNDTWLLTEEDIDDLQDDLHHYWPSLIKTIAFKFWALTAAGINPTCNNSYTYEHFHSALSDLGTHVNLQCYNHKKRQILMQIKIPLSKDLSIGCNTPEENFSKSFYKPCTHKADIYFYPITQHPHNPCP